jgi:hypothetical protein
MLKAGLFRQWSGSSRQQQQEQGEGTRPVAVTQPSVLARLRHSRAVVGLAAAWAPVQAALKRFVKVGAVDAAAPGAILHWPPGWTGSRAGQSGKARIAAQTHAAAIVAMLQAML